MNKNNILIITNEFLPYTRSLGGILRMLTLSEFLSKNNYSVHVLTSKSYHKKIEGYQNILENISLHYVNNYKNYGKVTKKNIKSNFTFYVLSILRVLFYNFYHSLICFGFDQARINLKKYKIQSAQIIEKYKIKHVIISSPPFSLFLISKYLKKKNLNIKIIHDYRDSWTLRFNSNHLLKKIATKYIENNTVNFVDNITCASNDIKNKILENLSIKEKKNIIVIFNGYINYDKNISIKKFQKTSTIKIGYFGMITDNPNGYRDLNIIYKNINKEVENKFKFFFYGPHNIKSKKILNYKSFKFNKSIDHQSAILKMNEMDYLLLIHSEKETASEVLTTKLFDYIFTKKPIIVISNGETEAGQLIEKYKIGKNINLQHLPLSDTLLEIINTDNFNQLNEMQYNYFSRENQNLKFLQILND
tara:strand:- start:683 stop:1936 length:1254 start_codon:yes stop_codon:yes gene_type:complete